MKGNAFFRALIIGIALAAVCAASGWGQTPDADAKAAAQLAAKLGGKGKTAVDGATVTLTGEAELKSALTVPAGVTLDLTATKAALRLKNGAKLTVDGAVNARGGGDHGKGWVEGSLRLDGGKTLINGSGTISLKSKGRLLNVWEKCRLTLDGVTLAGIADNDSSLIEVSNGGELLMKSGKITGNTRIGKEWTDAGGVAVWQGIFTMEGGEISGNSAQGGTGANGGGVKIGGKGSVFTMKGGKISGNSASGSARGAHGGGVCVDSDEGGAVFTLEGGEISGNSVTGNTFADAGGVYVYHSTFTMSGGIISGNIASGSQEVKGGGVRVSGEETGALFTMKGGVIAGNSASGSVCGWGGGVYVSDTAAFIMQGGTIYGNSDTLPAGADPSLANIVKGLSENFGAAINVDKYMPETSAKWGTGGTYTKGGVPQSGGSDIGNTDDTLIAIPKGKK